MLLLSRREFDACRDMQEQVAQARERKAAADPASIYAVCTAASAFANWANVICVCPDVPDPDRYAIALPIVDTFYVMFLRARSGRKIYYGSPDHIPLRLRRRLGGSTVRTVLVCYAAAVVLGGIGLGILFLDPEATLLVTGGVAVVVLAVLIWLGRVDMETS